jgi:hypothetical protein
MIGVILIGILQFTLAPYAIGAFPYVTFVPLVSAVVMGSVAAIVVGRAGDGGPAIGARAGLATGAYLILPALIITLIFTQTPFFEQSLEAGLNHPVATQDSFYQLNMVIADIASVISAIVGMLIGTGIGALVGLILNRRAVVVSQ